MEKIDDIKFSIIVVCLNPGKLLAETIDSIASQSYENYEVIVKDGLSKDGSVEELINANPLGDRLRVFEKPDKSIYNAMNQAVEFATGNFLYFLNCGDSFYDGDVLLKVAETINNYGKKENVIYYGDIYELLRNNRVTSNPKLDGFGLYRNVPCHQTCFYSRDLFALRAYNPKYRVRADYEHFLYCFYEKKARTIYTGTVIASYQGGGFSETPENIKRSKEEHKEITGMYMNPADIRKYKLILFLTLAPLRTKMAESKAFSGFYQRIKKALYKG
ncbi:MAG: glycosyltransferase [Acetatifactor sp.]|nr:glycosyltransferase [Acetatifactor sp.]